MRNRRTRTVIGAGGRMWVLRRSIIWRPPQRGYGFELDVTSGADGVVGGLAVLWCMVAYIFIHNHPHVPWYMGVVAVAIVAVLGAWWVSAREWTMTAEAVGPIERWCGTVRGRGNARAELRAVERSIRTHGSPAREGCLLASTHPIVIMNLPPHRGDLGSP